MNQFQNPANITDSKTTYCFNLAMVGLNFQTNYARWEAPFSLIKFSTFTVPDKYKNATGDKILWYPKYLAAIDKKQKSQTYMNFDGIGPFFSYQNGKIGIGIGARFRYMNSINNASKNLSTLLLNGTNNSFIINKKNGENSGNLNSMFLNQYTLSLGTRASTSDENYVKIGVNVNYFLSNNFVNYKLDNADYLVTVNAADNKKQDLSISNLSGKMNIASNFGPISLNSFTSQMASFQGLGTGFGLDLGVVYEYRPDYTSFSRTINGNLKINNSKATYAYKWGVSITDLAKLNFKNSPQTNITTYTNKSATILPLTYPKFDGFENVEKITSREFDGIKTPETYQIYLPTTIHTTFDYHLKNKIFLNIYYFQNLTKKSKMGPVAYSGIFFTPRYEGKIFEFSIPVGLSNDFQNFNLGLHTRIYSFILGSDNISGWFNLGNPRALSLYTGIHIPVYQKSPKSPLKCTPQY
jgi:hypothetical protein